MYVDLGQADDTVLGVDDDRLSLNPWNDLIDVGLRVVPRGRSLCEQGVAAGLPSFSCVLR
jgi:hypothetical protein